MTVAIFGSCVTRDLFEVPSRCAAARPLRRAVVGDQLGRAAGADRRRARAGSIPPGTALACWPTSTRRSSLRSSSCGRTWLVIDLIDERFDLLRVGGRSSTVSSALQAAGLDGQEARGRAAAAECPPRAASCSLEPRRVRRRVTAVVPAERIVLHRALWCSALPGRRRGRRPRPIAGWKLSKRQNEMLTRGYDALADGARCEQDDRRRSGGASRRRRPPLGARAVPLRRAPTTRSATARLRDLFDAR